MATGVIFTNGTFQGVGNNGQVVALGNVYFTDSATGDPVITYRDSALSSANTHPVPLSSSGKADIFLIDGVYDVTLKDKNDNVVWTITDFSPAGSGTVQWRQNIYPTIANQTDFATVNQLVDVLVYVNGVLQTPNVDYSVAGNVLSFIVPIEQTTDIVTVVGGTPTARQEILPTVIYIQSIADLDNVDFTEYPVANVRDTEQTFNYDITKALVNNTLTVINGWVLQGKLILDTVDEIVDLTSSDEGRAIFVKDLDRGGDFIYDSAEVSNHNSGTNFHGSARQYSGAVNALWFGADNTGVTDTTVALQKAFDMLKVFIPRGKYQITAPLVARSGCDIVGEGSMGLSTIDDTNFTVLWKTTNTADNLGYDSVISCHNEIMDPVYTAHANGNEMKVSNLSIVGNRTVNPYTIGYGGDAGNNSYGIYCGAGGNNYFSNISIVNTENALYNSQIWLSEVSNILAYGRIYHGAGTSTTYSNCEAGFNTIEGFWIAGSYITLNSCASDAGGAGRYVFKDAQGLVVNGCGLEGINNGLRDYDYVTGRGMYIQFRGNCSAVVNGFRAFSLITQDSQTPQQAGAYYISAEADDKITFNNDVIDRQLPPNSVTDNAYKIFNIVDSAKVVVNNGARYTGENWDSYNFYHTKSGTGLGKLNIDKIFSYTPTVYIGGSAIGVYAIRKGEYSIKDNYLEISVQCYFTQKVGTGNVEISLPPLTSVGTLINSLNVECSIVNVNNDRDIIGQIDNTTQRLKLLHTTDASPVTDVDIPASPFVTVFINNKIPLFYN